MFPLTINGIQFRRMVYKFHRRVHRLSWLLNPPPSEKRARQKHPTNEAELIAVE